jgi:hypothetical protein
MERKAFPTNAWIAYYKLTNLLYILTKLSLQREYIKNGKEGKKREREKDIKKLLRNFLMYLKGTLYP